MSLRVIGGTAKGHRLKAVPGDTTRPIMDRVKEALFNIIGEYIVDATFLDLFAGTGSVGIEALSRGASKAIFIDLERKAIQTIRENLKITKFEDRATILQTSAFAYLHTPPAKAFDFIYVAPPQYKGLWLDTLEAIDKQPKWVANYTEIIVQVDPKELWDTELQLQNLEEIERRKYGKTLLIFYGKVGVEAVDQ